METKVIPCLIRVGENHKKPRFIYLDGCDKVTVGRSADATVCLMSTAISRCHAIIKREHGNWSILDNKSLNGIAVNGDRIKPQENIILREGDLVQFGIAQNQMLPPEYVYKFFSAARIKRPVKRKPDSTTDTVKSKKKPCMASHPGGPLTEQGDHVSSSGQNGSKLNWSPFREYQAQLSEQERLSTEKMKDFEKKLAEMQRLVREKESAEADIKQKLEEEKIKSDEKEKIVEELRQKEEEMKSEMKEKEKKFEVEKVEITKKVQEMQAALEEKLKEKEEALMCQLTAQRESLVLEKLKVEQKFNRALEEKDRHLEKELLNQKENLEKVIANKELEQKVLESQLKDTQTENAKQKEAALRAREDVLANFTDLMETELQCSICSELFIKAASLNCSHSFCQLCISQWMKRKKECPICRAAFSSFTRSIVLDSYIDRMVEQLSEELKDRRKELIKAREEEQKKFDEENNSSGTSRGGRGGQNQRRGRGGGRRGASRNTEPPPAATSASSSGVQTRNPVPVAAVPIILSSESDSDVDMDNVDYGSSGSESDLEGETGAYFGGYGRCFICGNRGHWANGCPFR